MFPCCQLGHRFGNVFRTYALPALRVPVATLSQAGRAGQWRLQEPVVRAVRRIPAAVGGAEDGNGLRAHCRRNVEWAGVGSDHMPADPADRGEFPKR